MNTIKHPITEQEDEALYQSLERFYGALHNSENPRDSGLYAAIENLCEHLAAPIWGLLEGWKMDATIDKRRLERIRDSANSHSAEELGEMAADILRNMDKDNA